VSCDLEGKCQCRDNFDGDRCEKCKANFYNFPNCEGCNCDPAGIAGTFQGCGSLPTGELCQCKERVEGRICNQCKKLFWNLQPTNPNGCEGELTILIMGGWIMVPPGGDISLKLKC
jgi:laminin alpha 3/5